eukprot:2669668-Amphidinium_carterae.2
MFGLQVFSEISFRAVAHSEKLHLSARVHKFGITAITTCCSSEKDYLSNLYQGDSKALLTSAWQGKCFGMLCLLQSRTHKSGNSK